MSGRFGVGLGNCPGTGRIVTASCQDVLGTGPGAGGREDLPMVTQITRALRTAATAGALIALGLAGTAGAASASTAPRAERAHPITVYVADGGGNMVTPISTVTNKAGTPITVGKRPGQIVVTPNGKTAYVIAGGSVVPIRTATNTALKPIKGTSGASYIAITPDGMTAYVAHCCFSQSSDEITPIDIATNTALKPITWKPGPAWGASIAITPDGKTVYIASTAGYVTQGRQGDRTPQRGREW